MRISDWSSDVCSSDLLDRRRRPDRVRPRRRARLLRGVRRRVQRGVIMDSWGALSAEAQSLTGGGGRRCHIARLMDILPDDEARKAVEKAMRNKDLSAAALEKAIAARVGMDKTPS